MSTSQNGWPANDRSVIVKTYVAGTDRYITTRNGDVSKIFAYLIGRIHREVETIDGGIYDDWGYAERPVRGSSTTLSNHASGTGIDVNATKHVLGARNTFDPAKKARLRAILNDCQGAIRWGGDYNGRADEMHFEINVNANRLREIVASLSLGGAPAQPKPTQGAPIRPPVQSGPIVPNLVYTDPEAFPQERGFRKGDGPTNDIATIQARIGYLLYPAGFPDGKFGPATEEAVIAFQRKNNLEDDGVVGPGTWRVLFSNAARKNVDNAPAAFNFGPEYPGVQLFLNSRGPHVLAYQRMMKSRGWDIADDGHFGSRTLKVTKQFQESKGLTANGYVGPDTWNTARTSTNK